jgi:hypothetical protein
MSKTNVVLGAAEALLIAAGVFVASGYGSAGARETATAAKDSAPINACALLKDAEIEAVIGKKVAPGQRHDEGDVNSGDYVVSGTYSSTCLWRVVTDLPPPNDPSLPLGGNSFAILNAMQWPKGGDDASKFLQSFRDAGKEHVIDMEPVAVQIGDEALWWGDGVAVRKGDRSFGISVHMIGGRPNERGWEEDLAKKIAPRL